MRKPILPRAAIIWLLTGAVSANGGNVDRKNLSFSLGAVAKFEPMRVAVPPVRFVDNFSPSMRFVPIHPDDEYKVSPENNGFIEDGVELSPPKVSILRLVGGLFSSIELHQLKLKVRIEGGVGSLPLIGDAMRMDLGPGWMKERDYLSDPGSPERGEGTVLTYYGVLYGRRSFASPYFLVELEWGSQVGNKCYGFIVGMRESPYKLTFEQGWDRYDKLERYRSFPLGTFSVRDVYLCFTEEKCYDLGSRLDCYRKSLRFGIAFPCKWKSAGTGVDVHFRKLPLYLELEIAFSFSNLLGRAF